MAKPSFSGLQGGIPICIVWRESVNCVRFGKMPMENSAQQKQRGCLRTGLILVILFVSISGSIWMLGLRSGMYSGLEMPETPIVIRGGTLFDGTGSSLIRNTQIVVVGGEIQCIGCPAPADAIVIDATNKAILPGLIDMHVHYYAPSQENAGASKLSLLLNYLKYRPDVRQNLHRAGITTIRSVGDVAENIMHIKNLQAGGDIEGPEVFCAGPVFTVAGGHPAATTFQGDEALIRDATRLADTPIRGEEAVIALERQGVDGIRVAYEDRGGTLSRLPKEVLTAIVEQSKKSGLWTAVSTGSPTEVRDALAAGATTIERGNTGPADSVLWREVATSDCMLVPLLGSYADPDSLVTMQENAAMAAAYGVPIGVGSDIQTDSRGYAGSLHREMELLVEAGLTPTQVLLGATSQAARYLKTDHYLGTLKAGMRANLILVDGAPWNDISDIRKVEQVMQGGKWVLRDGKIVD